MKPTYIITGTVLYCLLIAYFYWALSTGIDTILGTSP